MRWPLSSVQAAAAASQLHCRGGESHDPAPTLQPTFTESSTQVPCTHKHGNLDLELQTNHRQSLQLYLEHDPTADCHLVVAAAVALVVHLVLTRPVPRPVEVLLVVPSEL